MTVYWVVWDAAARWIVDRLVAEDQLPAVRELWDRGVRAGGRPPSPNCQTSPSLATLFTGTPTVEHGVTGFTVPDGLVGQRSGFGPGFPLTPPVWRKHGLRGAFVHAPWAYGGSTVDVAIEAYSGRLAKAATLALGPDGTAEWPVGDFGVQVDTDHDVVRLRAAGVEYEVADDWVPVPLSGATGFWVRRVADTLVRTGTWTVRVDGADRELVDALAGIPVFAGEAPGRLYRTGLFGPRIVDGGDGTAERAYESSVGCVVRSFDAASRIVLDHTDADLVVIYLPWTDDVGHELVGWCDEDSAAHRPDAAEELWEVVRHCYRAADAVLGAVLSRAGTDDTVLLCADHGIVGSTHLVHVNELLIAEGLAVRAEHGGLDPARSAVVYHPANNGSLRVNRQVVADEQVASTMRRAMAALNTVPVLGFLDPLGRPWRDGEVAFVAFAEDYQPSADVDGGPAVRPMPRSASHVVNTGSDRLHATFAAAGPGIPAGVDLGVVDNTFAARLVEHSFGLGPSPLSRPSRSSSMSDIVALRWQRVQDFLADRDLKPSELEAFMRARVGDGELVLSSSPVHGLANPTSDLDFLRIQNEPIDGPRISTKIFDRGHHLEVVSFSVAEVERNLAELSALATLPPADVVAGFRSWDKRFEPRRKQTERIVNGITLDGRAPYLAALPELGVVWSRASLHTAAEQLVHLSYAEAAGETRGRVGYAYNVLLHLMDAVLSMHGDVYTTRKWYLLRWTRFVREGQWLNEGYAAVGAAIETARAALSPSFSGAFAPLYADLVTAVAQVTGAAQGLSGAVVAAEGAEYTPFLPGSGVVSGGGTSVVVTGAWPPDPAPKPVAELAGLGRQEAATALRAVRAGVAAASIRYEGSAE